MPEDQSRPGGAIEPRKHCFAAREPFPVKGEHDGRSHRGPWLWMETMCALCTGVAAVRHFLLTLHPKLTAPLPCHCRPGLLPPRGTQGSTQGAASSTPVSCQARARARVTFLTAPPSFPLQTRRAATVAHRRSCVPRIVRASMCRGPRDKDARVHTVLPLRR